MNDALPTHERTTMRVLVFRLEVLDTDPSTIREVARVDVTVWPATGSGIGKLMSAKQGRHGHTVRPFAGRRLENAVWNPFPADILVSADAGTLGTLPDEIRRGLPAIVVLAAWRRLQPIVPSILQEICWEDVSNAFVPKAYPTSAEREAWFTAMALRTLLNHASPNELVALSVAS